MKKRQSVTVSVTILRKTRPVPVSVGAFEYVREVNGYLECRSL